MEFHLEELGKHCRVCGRRLAKAKGKLVTYSSRDYAEQLKASFFFSASQDDPDIHPPQFCQSCYCSMKRCSNAAKDGVDSFFHNCL